MRKGIAILFHGSPGTGKTASAYEIARRTGRDLYAVDISRTKSMWFGESEKIIKDLFDRYGRLVKNSDKAPILLFNEADAIFSTRKGITSSPVSQTENTIQNIILQEMENLNGIMIATTNLTVNLDKAFERRFLFKIAFTRPDTLTRQQILLDKLPVLQPAEAAQIASRFDLSGGNIENVARKTEMYKVLHGKYPEIEQLTAFCGEEGMVDPQRRAIGF
jgi:SpoVK/Ycf46/Vps4 family AAA+-type ATPase